MQLLHLGPDDHKERRDVVARQGSFIVYLSRLTLFYSDHVHVTFLVLETCLFAFLVNLFVPSLASSMCKIRSA